MKTKITTERALNSSITRITNNLFKKYKSVPRNFELIRLVVLSYNLENNGSRTITIKSDYKEIINKYIEENFKEYLKEGAKI